MAVYHGNHIHIEIEGESHAAQMTAHVVGMPSFAYDEAALLRFLDRRRAKGGVFATTRTESDLPHFEGMGAGGTVSADWRVTILNQNVRGRDYDPLYACPRPGHADYARFLRDGTLDYAGGGRFSGRMTAPLAVVGGLCLQYLARKDIAVHAYLQSVGKATGPSYKDDGFGPERVVWPAEDAFPALGNTDAMLAEIAAAKADADSVGGRIECIVTGLTAGYGDNLFEGLEGRIAPLLLAIPAVKGVEFGDGFGLAAMRGSEANDPLLYDDAQRVYSETNHMGGILGGISTGDYLSLAVAVKPTPSIGREQRTVNLSTRQNTTIRIEGRHDACIAPRAVPVVEAAVAIALLDVMMDGQ